MLQHLRQLPAQQKIAVPADDTDKKLLPVLWHRFLSVLS